MLDRKNAPSQSPFQPIKIKQVESERLENGVPIHLLQSGNQSLLKLEFVFRAGTWFENKPGLSYLSSKMLTEGTFSRTSKNIADNIAGFGAFVEVHQGAEHVNLTFYLLEKHLSNLLPIIADMIFDSTYPERELENLKTITSQTAKLNREKNQFIASVEFRKNIFGEGHPYGRQYWEDDIQSISQSDVYSFAAEYFYTSNLEIFVSGQFDKSSVFKSVNNYFGKKNDKASSKSFQLFSINKSERSSVIIEKKEAMQSSLRLGCLSINRSHDDFVSLQVANEILGGFFGSRLMKNIREDKGFTYGIHSSLHSMVNGSYFVISTDVKKESTFQTLEEISKELKILRSVEVDLEELEIVKSYMLGRFMNAINTPFALMDKFKILHYNKLDYSYYAEYVNAVQNVSSKTIVETSCKYLDFNGFSQIVVGGLENC